MKRKTTMCEHFVPADECSLCMADAMLARHEKRREQEPAPKRERKKTAQPKEGKP